MQGIAHYTLQGKVWALSEGRLASGTDPTAYFSNEKFRSRYRKFWLFFYAKIISTHVCFFKQKRTATSPVLFRFTR